MRYFFVAIFIGLSILIPLGAQSVHSRLTDPQLLKRFDTLSHKLMCTCGCNMPLHNCNHTGHCNAWPARDALDKLLLEGKTDAEILAGFRNGFGAIAETNEAFAMARQNDYSYMLDKFRDGFGSQIMTRPETNFLAVFSILGGILCIGVVLLFLRSRTRKKQATAVSTHPPIDDTRKNELLKRLSKDDYDDAL
ncbi:MAG TPA: cytochrome c-type biogenesis protein CcmH [Turneriella sp.]|nr:cytochrome c-type biogenesis protein CcmH [Turneriella sp.]